MKPGNQENEKHLPDKAGNVYSLMPNQIAWVLAIVVFPLIWVGGLVTTFDAGMAVPDWPNTYGYNLFLYPIRDWFFGPWDLFVEHGHRLLGSLAGVISIILLIVTFCKDSRRWVRISSVILLLLVVIQGLLGGVRVVLDERIVAMIHGCVGPAYFASVVAMTVVTSRWWIERKSKLVNYRFRSSQWMKSFAFVMLLSSYCQLILGASIRHIPVMADAKVFKSLVVWHITTAILILLFAVLIFLLSRTSNLKQSGLRRSATYLLFAVTMQVVLGVTTWVIKFGWPDWFESFAHASRFVVPEKSFMQMNLVTAHVAVGSLILATATYHWVRTLRSSYLADDPCLIQENNS